MLMAVLVAVSGAFAFKEKPLPPGDEFTFTTQPTVTGPNPDGTYDVTFTTGTQVDITGDQEGIKYNCIDPPVPVCVVKQTESTTVVVNPTAGTTTYTHVIVKFGTYQKINP